MKCKYCDKEIESGLLYCPFCGKSVQLVPEYNVLEEELLSKIVEDKDRSKEDFAEGVYAKSKLEESNKAVKNEAGKKVNKHFILSIFLVIVIVLVGASIIFYLNYTNSFSYKLSKARDAEEEQRYTAALTYYKEAYELDASSFDAVYGMAKIYYNLKEYDEAIEAFKLALDTDSENVEIYSYLLLCYSKQNDMDSIYELAESTDNEGVLSLVSEYIIIPPEFSLEGGNYEDDITIFLTATDDCQIFYSTNGKDPRVSGKLFTNEIILKEGTTTVKAVSLNESGEYSEVVSKTYNISYTTLGIPSVSPNGGTFTTDQLITIDVPAGGKAYYSWDGSDPVKNGLLYEEPFPVIEGSSVLSVVIIDKRGNRSSTYHGEFHYIKE